MVRGDKRKNDSPDLATVLDALEDPDCRAIIGVLTEPMTAKEIASATDIPTATTYRKLELLSDAALLDEGVELHQDGRHATLYAVGFEEVVLSLSDDLKFEIEVEQRPRAPAERLARMWTEVRKET